MCQNCCKGTNLVQLIVKDVGTRFFATQCSFTNIKHIRENQWGRPYNGTEYRWDRQKM